MKLALDEHYSPLIAERLRDRGYDVIAVGGRVKASHPNLRGFSDAELLHWARSEGRVFVTENVRDFIPLHQSFLARAESHAGIILTSRRTFSRHPDGIGRLADALAAFIEREAERGLHDQIAWL